MLKTFFYKLLNVLLKPIFFQGYFLRGRRLIKRTFNVGLYRIKLKNGLKFWLDFSDSSQFGLVWSIHTEGIWRGKNEDFLNILYLMQCLKVGDTFFDVGANIGVYSLHAALRVGGGRTDTLL